MKGVPDKPLLGDDPAFVASWRAAIAGQPVCEQARSAEFMELCFAFERDLHDCRMDVRDCNTIMARTVGRLEMQSVQYAR